VSEARRLGRGLEALLGPVSKEQAEKEGNLRELPVTAIRPNPFQPRTRVDEEPLKELVASIEASGLLQPVVVRSKGSSYELIAGERRWRAVQRLGWTRIPAVIREADDRTLLTLALIENLQRDNLSPIDEALGYQRLQEQFGVAQAEVARLVGRDRSTVANLLRLLGLPEAVRDLVDHGALSAGHARALLGLTDTKLIVTLARQAVADGWSVREMEARVRQGPASAKRPKTTRVAPGPVSAEVQRVEDALRKHLGTDVRVTQRRKGRGIVQLSYYSNDDLARLLELILGTPFEG
jgi:ParB family chromosome partitioning protein